jgi:hypothetical protein
MDSGQGPVVGSCGHGDESSGSTEGKNFISDWATISFSRRTSLTYIPVSTVYTVYLFESTLCSWGSHATVLRRVKAFPFHLHIQQQKARGEKECENKKLGAFSSQKEFTNWVSFKYISQYSDRLRYGRLVVRFPVWEGIFGVFTIVSLKFVRPPIAFPSGTGAL